jgi:hypothetical protein
MAYLIGEEERSLELDLLQELAAMLREEIPELALADATFRVRSALRILRVEEQAVAERLCARFGERGFRCFTMEKLLEVPPAAHLNLEKPELGGEVELAVAARLNLVTEKKVTTTRHGISLPMALAGVPVPVKRTEESTTHESDTRYHVDLFTADKHWRARPGNPMAIRVVLLDAVRPSTVLSPGAREMMQGEKCHVTFGQEAEYATYVTWWYQVRYAERKGGREEGR